MLLLHLYVIDLSRYWVAKMKHSVRMTRKIFLERGRHSTAEALRQYLCMEDNSGMDWDWDAQVEKVAGEIKFSESVENFKANTKVHNHLLFFLSNGDLLRTFKTINFQPTVRGEICKFLTLVFLLRASVYSRTCNPQKARCCRTKGFAYWLRWTSYLNRRPSWP